MKTEILFLAGMCLCACSRTPQEQTSFPRVKVVHAEVMEAPSLRCYTFISQPYRLSELSFRVGGLVHAFDVQQGQFFRKGQLIAAIDERDFVIQKQRTEALYRQAEVDYARISSLYAKDNISGMNYEQAKANYERTKADYEAAVNAWEDSRLYAPFDGYVQQAHIERYQDVKPSVPVVTFIDLSRIKVEAYVPEDMALQMRQKDSVACVVRFNALPDREFVPSEYFLTQRMSLAAIIIAMGMLVDNAIVVTDNAQIGIKRGKSRYQSLIEGAIKPQWALLGATFIAICSFLPLYLAPASVAEIVKPLFVVLAVSLGLSWILALCQTTTFGNFILKEAVPGGAMKDPYDTKLYHKFEKFLTLLIKRRFVTLTTVFVTLVLSLVIMAVMPQSFFPKMNKPYFRADLVFPEGFSIHAVDQDVMKVEDYLKNHEKVKSYSVTLGGTPLRYYLASSSFGPKSNYANVMVETKDPEDAAEVEQQFYEHMTQNFPNIITRSALFALSPVPEAAIEIGFIGENPDTLTALVERAKKIARQCDMVTDIRSNWGDKVPVWKPMFSQQKGLRLGITRQQVANSFRTATNGLPLGEYREGDVSLPILLKDEDVEKMNLNDVKSVPVFSTKGNSVKVEQVIDNFALGYDYNVVRRFNRERCMMMQCEPKRGANTMAAFKQVLTAVQEQMQLPEGYKMKYFGEQETQDVSNAALAKNIPLTFLLIYVVLLFLFPSNYRKPVLIMLMLPLVFIGVVWGLLLFGKSLDFFAILGLLGLIGMNIKNAIVLVDEIGLQLKDGKGAVPAVVEATKTRIVPVTMASGTTILGMLPLLGDAMFAGMAATIMGGLFVSTVLTIFVLPVTYCIFFKIRADR